MRRRLIIIGVALVVLIVPGVIIILAVNRSPKLQNTVLQVANIKPTNTNTAKVNTNTAPTDPLGADRTAVIFTARNFAERFGSGSNQNNFSNLVSAETYGTVAFNAALNASITQQRKTLTTTPFLSTITKALTISVSGLSAKSASVTVTTQRNETKDKATRVYYQDLIMQLLKVGNDWKVNSAVWKAT